MINYRLLKELEHKTWLEQAVREFAKTNATEKEYQGLVQQTYENILHATEFKTPSRYLWVIEQDNKPVGYVLSYVSKDVDNTLCYWLMQAYADPSVRGQQFLKDLYPTLKEHAKSLFCHHVLIPSSRGTSYIRWLGADLHQYAVILKEDI